MSAAFTPGPWIVHPALARVDCQKISDRRGLLPVCQMLWPTDERTEDETEANAHLIAAAPGLYDALKIATDTIAIIIEALADHGVGYSENATTVAAMGRAMLAKARGEQS